jgi:hypothetical protein
MQTREEIYNEALHLLRCVNEMASEEETRGEVMLRLAGVDVSSEGFIAAIRFAVLRDKTSLLDVPGAFEAIYDAFQFGVALASHHHKSKKQESANGSKGEGI